MMRGRCSSVFSWRSRRWSSAAGPPTSPGQTYFFFAPLIIPLFILGVPLVDMAFAFVRRTAKRTQFHSPDKDHIHHRLVRLGHGPRRTVVILWAWTALLSGFVLVPLYFPRGNLFIPLGLGVLVLSLYTWFHPGLRKRDPALDENGGQNGGQNGTSSNGICHCARKRPGGDERILYVGSRDAANIADANRAGRADGACPCARPAHRLRHLRHPPGTVLPRRCSGCENDCVRLPRVQRAHDPRVFRSGIVAPLAGCLPIA